MRSLLRRLRLPRLQVNLLSGHHAARCWLALAAFVVGIAFLVLLSEATGRAPGPLPPPAVETAAAWVTFLGVCATVIAIVAAYVELRTVFPQQALIVEAHRETRFYDADSEYQIDHTRNDKTSALINAYRLEVQLEDENGFVAFFDEHDHIHRFFMEHRWQNSASWEMPYSLGSAPSLHWVMRKNEPFFPGSKVVGPIVPVGQWQRWRVTWWTDRAGPEQKVFALSDIEPRALQRDANQ